MNKKETGIRGEAKGMPLTIKGRRVSKDYLIEHGIIEDYFNPIEKEDDTVYRQAAIAVADSSDYVGLSAEDVKKVTDEVVKGLKQLPSAQPEIIRCRGCKYYLRPHGCAHIDGMATTQENGFCSYAERITNE